MSDDNQIPSREWVRDVIRDVCRQINDKAVRRDLRTIANYYGAIAYSHKLLEDKIAVIARKAAEKDERIRKMLLNGVDEEQRKRFVEAERKRAMPGEYTEDGRRHRRGGYGD